MLSGLKILLQADSAVNLQQVFIENAIVPQMPIYSALWFIINHNTWFILLLVNVFWH